MKALYFCGSPKFKVQENFDDKKIFNGKVDFHSVGVVVFFFMSGGKLQNQDMWNLLNGKSRKKSRIPQRKLVNYYWIDQIFKWFLITLKEIPTIWFS